MIVNLTDIRTNAFGFSKLIELADVVLSVSGQNIVIDCNGLRWFDAHMAAPLMSIIKQSEMLNNKISFVNLNNKTQIILQKNGFLTPRIKDNYGTTISLEQYQTDEQKKFSEYVDDNLSAQEMPEMSDDLESKFFEGVDELFTNSVIHSKTACGIFTCGQFFPNKNRLDFMIVDAGIGIKENIKRNLGLELNAEDAIDWAMSKGNTTRQGDIPGGLGLKIIRDFIALNEGKIIVVSGSGYWSQNKKKVTKQLLNGKFPGTAVVMEINTADDYVYYLQDEIGPDDIF